MSFEEQRTRNRTILLFIVIVLFLFWLIVNLGIRAYMDSPFSLFTVIGIGLFIIQLKTGKKDE